KKGVEELPRTEWKIIEQVGTGAANKEIAETLNLSDGTVRNYLSTILNKLELRDRTQLAIWAVQTNVASYVKDDE
ncbi:MAG: LuxR C-terminal-related transcriptional regulator, partial [Lachnospiraceae bacterium]|nr:LuxR C-terminal-related transcriptional regulator [Lachnospiraceae bacterium]